jgi:membrane-associated PAP2 superfamily phosphatase
MKLTTAQRAASSHDECGGSRDPAAKMGSLIVTGSAIGGVLSIGLFIIVWGDLPVVRPFLIAAIGLGAIFGLFLWARRQEGLGA